MKFCNLLRETSVDLPEIHSLYVCYKGLKKTLKRITRSLEQGNEDDASNLQENFVTELNSFIQQINDQFMENEEQRVIEMGHLEEQAISVQTSQRCQEVTKLFVDFHGQMLLFIHSAMLSYTAMLKILKKHSKKLGNPIDAVQREQLCSMPICQTEIASSIAQRAENAIENLMERQAQLRTTTIESDVGDESLEVSTMLGQVRVALRTWEQLMTTASTPSTVLMHHIPVMPSTSLSSETMTVSSSNTSVESEGS